MLGRPLLAWATAPFTSLPEIHRIALVVAPDRLAEAQALCQREGWARAQVVAAPTSQDASIPSDTPSDAAASALRRRDTMLAGLRALGEDCATVLIHDATCPLVTSEIIRAGLAAVARTGAATAAEPVKETLKLVRKGLVAGTLPRERLVRTQSPTVFSRERLLAAYAACDPVFGPPDEATLALAAGLPLVTFPGSHENLRVASPADLPLVEAILRARHP